MVAPRRDSEERGKDDDKPFDIIGADLFTALVGDVLDRMGQTHQFLPPEIRPLRAGAKMVGRAMPVLEADYPPGGRNGPLSDRAFGAMFADDEGILVIPRHCGQEAVAAALEKAATENRMAMAIQGGMGAQEAYAKFGVM